MTSEPDRVEDVCPLCVRRQPPGAALCSSCGGPLNTRFDSDNPYEAPKTPLAAGGTLGRAAAYFTGVVLIFLSTVIAFTVTCFPIGLLGANAQPEVGIVLGVLVGLVAAGATLVFSTRVFNRVMRRKDKGCAMTPRLRDHTFLGMTQSLCPECLALVPAKIIARGKRVYFRKRCATHGVREDFVCSDVALYDQMQYSLPGKVPPRFGVEPDRGRPFDCGLCTEHEQHTCVGLVEMTSSCNLKCPMCYASSGPGGTHLSYEECVRSVDRLVEVEGRAEVLQLSGGEPTIHPDFLRVLEYAASRPIDVVMINTNGVRLAHDPALLDGIARLGPRVEVYFQFDGFDDRGSLALRGEPLVETKLRAIEALGRRGVKTSLVCTLQPGVNDHEIGALVKFGLERPWVTGVSFQPATYSGRHVLPDDLERRVTFPDVIRAVAEQTDGVFREDDFMPLPCAHPNCHSLTYAFRAGGEVVPLSRFIDARNHLEILSNGILFSRNRARQLIEQYLAKIGNCGVGCGPVRDGDGDSDPVEAAASTFFARALSEQLAQSDVFRITVTSFLDAYNFDVRRVMKCCIHHVLPSGHVIPFCAYNVLYREGHAVLPALRDAGVYQAEV